LRLGDALYRLTSTSTLRFCFDTNTQNGYAILCVGIKGLSRELAPLIPLIFSSKRTAKPIALIIMIFKQ
jgi:hypothetical protein